ncbi:lipocalin-like domain-containing protein [Aquisalimonas sp.]|uniref:lipocalin-like domain-containing protein n=1 Tax=unclassified Aquisalimonas TaxID=2644645 RepID=UPI0025BAC921|nr:lipocalin-like domain-containing protein [Aquisalimonas sp.]
MATDPEHRPIGRRMRWQLGITVAAVLVVLLLLRMWSGGDDTEAPDDDGFDVTGALSGEEDAAGFARVTGPEPLSFPEDHGPHPDYRHEWWYVTGNVRDADDRHFGFQVTLFRFNVAADPPEREAALATNQLWMGHLAITDTESGAFHHRERFVRGAAGLAGGVADPFRIWIEDWEMTGDGEDMMPLRLDFPDDDLGLDITLKPRKPLVLQGEDGYSRKGPEPGNASRYYSYTRLAASGELMVGDTTHGVTGQAWMDREWGTSTLSEDQAGWDWFSIQMEDDRDIMFYHLRRNDGSIDPLSKGLLVEPDGDARVLSLDEVELEAQRHWESGGGTRYPVAWRMQVPNEGLDLRLEAVMDGQELRGAFRYWEGAIRITAEEGPDGVGYAELTGY